MNELICKQQNGPGSHQPPNPTLTRDEILRRVSEILKRVREGKKFHESRGTKFQEINILSFSKMVQGLITPKIWLNVSEIITSEEQSQSSHDYAFFNLVYCSTSCLSKMYQRYWSFKEKNCASMGKYQSGKDWQMN